MTDHMDYYQFPEKADGTPSAPSGLPGRPSGPKPGRPPIRPTNRPKGDESSKPPVRLSAPGEDPLDDFDLDQALAFTPDLDLDTRDFEAVSPVRDARPYVDPRSTTVSADRAMAQEVLYSSGGYQPKHAPGPSMPAASATTALRADGLASGLEQDLDAYLEEAEPPHAAPPVTPEVHKSKTGKHRRRSGGLLRLFLDLAVVVVIAFMLAWGVRSYVIQPYEIPSGSMESTIVPGDHVLSYKLGYYFQDVQQGDVVTFWNPMHSELERQTAVDKVLIKRVIATGGQTVNLLNGKVYVDGVALDEPYTQGSTYPLLNTFNGMDIFFPYTVPEGYLWVMGDNRENSSDSRFFGAIDEDLVTGHAIIIYWPVDHFGKLS